MRVVLRDKLAGFSTPEGAIRLTLFLQYQQMTHFLTDGSPAGIDNPCLDEYNRLYRKTTRRWWQLSPTGIYLS